MFRLRSVFIALLLPTLVLAQDYTADPSDSVAYTPGFPFNDGLYFSFAAFRSNTPDVPRDQLRNKNGQALGDLRTASGDVWVPDSSAGVRKLALDGLWGFCDNGTVFVRAGNGFVRIGMLGSIAHLVYDATYRDWNHYGYYGNYGTRTYTVQEQRFLDMATGQAVPVSADGVYSLIERDQVLAEEFNAIPRKQRKEAILFQFVRRYNDRHPLFFPR